MTKKNLKRHQSQKKFQKINKVFSHYFARISHPLKRVLKAKNLSISKILKVTSVVFFLAFSINIIVNVIRYNQILLYDKDHLVLHQTKNVYGALKHSSLEKNILYLFTDGTEKTLDQHIVGAIILLQDSESVSKALMLDPRIEFRSNSRMTIGNFFRFNALNINYTNSDSPYEMVTIQLLDSISDLFGIALSDIVVVQKSVLAHECVSYDNRCFINELITFFSKFSSLRYNIDTFLFGNYYNLLEGFSSNLNKNDIIFYTNRAVFYEKINFMSIGLNEGTLIDNEVIVLSNLDLKRKMQELLSRKQIRGEQALIEIYNGTSTPGLASLHSHYISNLGVNIIRVGNFDTTKNTTLYIIDENRISNLSNTINLFQSLYGNNLIIKVGAYKYNSIGDLVLVLGQDI